MYNLENIRRLSPGEYAFSNQGRVVFLELLEHPDRPCSSEIRFSMARPGADGGKEVLADQTIDGPDLSFTFRQLPPDHKQIIAEFAEQRMLQEGKVTQVA